jgi:hypothetical protein
MKFQMTWKKVENVFYYALMGTIAGVVMGVVSGVLQVDASRADAKRSNPPTPIYREVPFNLNDGTPCTVLKGGTHSGMIGVTCNYSKSSK